MKDVFVRLDDICVLLDNAAKRCDNKAEFMSVFGTVFRKEFLEAEWENKNISSKKKKDLKWEM